MASVEMQAAAYLSAINPVAKKVWQDLENFQKSQGDAWSNLDYAEQEEQIDKYIIDPHIQEKYTAQKKGAPEADEVTEVFPRRRTNCGEKIVVDFDNEDGWTWRDEHSGPFSWMTRSQQDLSLSDLDDLDGASKNDGKRPNAPPRGKSKSPERDGANPSFAFKSDKSIWDSPFLSGGKAQNEEAANTAGEIFQKFGITFSFGHDPEVADESPFKVSTEEFQVCEEEEEEDEEEEQSRTDVSGFTGDGLSDTTSTVSPMSPRRTTEESKLLPRQREPESAAFTNSWDVTAQQDDRESTPTESLSERSSPERNCSASAKKKKKDKSTRWKGFKKEKKEAKLALMSDLSLSASSASDPPDTELELGYQGQLSPVFIEEPGESTTDGVLPGDGCPSSQFVFPGDAFANPQSTFGQLSEAVGATAHAPTEASLPVALGAEGVVNKAGLLDTWDSELFDDDDENKDVSLEVGSPSKTGFDFLDNW